MTSRAEFSDVVTSELKDAVTEAGSVLELNGFSTEMVLHFSEEIESFTDKVRIFFFNSYKFLV